jgi:hypothetical protein
MQVTRDQAIQTTLQTLHHQLFQALQRVVQLFSYELELVTLAQPAPQTHQQVLGRALRRVWRMELIPLLLPQRLMA